METEVTKAPPLPKWRRVWREGFAPDIGVDGLLALLKALREDDERLTQGSTTTPPPMNCVLDWPCEGACLIGYCGWIGEKEGEATVGEVEEYFARLCFQADQRIGEPAACRYLLNWFDDTPRDEMRYELEKEVVLALAERGVVV